MSKFEDVKVGDLISVNVPCLVRVLEIGPSEMAPGMRHFSTEVVDPAKRHEFDSGNLVPVDIHTSR